VWWVLVLLELTVRTEGFEANDEPPAAALPELDELETPRMVFMIAEFSLWFK